MQKLNMFEAVKQHVTTRQAASFYGLKVNRNGMCCCPFHSDRTPSMKVDTRYHCFGCGADGDVISFVQQMFDLNPKEAALKLAADFGIPVMDNRSDPARISGSRKRKDPRANRVIRAPDPETDFRTWAKGAVKTLIDYSWLLRDWKEKHAPASPEDEWHPLFCEALQNEAKTEYDLDILMFGSRDELRDFYEHDRKVVDTIEKRIREYREQERSGRTAESDKADIRSGSGHEELGIG